MLEKLKNFFSQQADANKDPASSPSDRQGEMRVPIATAVILLEVAHADGDFSQEEQNRIVEILKREFHLDDEELQEILHLSDEERKESIDIWHFTKIINDQYSDEEKYRIIESVWRVIYADGHLDKYEDCIVHKLSNLLHIPHDKMIQAKLKFLPKKQP